MKKSTKVSQSGDASIYDVAAQAGVSIVTVSRVFNDYPHVSERMKGRVLNAAEEVGYSPRVVSKPNLLGVVVGHLDHISAGDYKTRLITHIIPAAMQANYLVEFFEYDSIALATKSHVDAIIEVGLTEEELMRLKKLPRVPLCVINKGKRESHWNTISTNHKQEARLAAERLVNAGHKNIVLVLDELKGWGVESRRAGFEEVLDEVSPGCVPLVLSAEELSPQEIVGRLLKGKCTGCINFSDNYGSAIMDALQNEAGLRIPDDLSVICLENKAISAYWSPRLTAVEQPLADMADALIESLHGLLEGERESFDLVFKSRLIDRDSVLSLR